MIRIALLLCILVVCLMSDPVSGLNTPGPDREGDTVVFISSYGNPTDPLKLTTNRDSEFKILFRNVVVSVFTMGNETHFDILTESQISIPGRNDSLRVMKTVPLEGGYGQGVFPFSQDIVPLIVVSVGSDEFVYRSITVMSGSIFDESQDEYVGNDFLKINITWLEERLWSVGFTVMFGCGTALFFVAVYRVRRNKTKFLSLL